MNLETIVKQHNLNLHHTGNAQCIILDTKYQNDYDFMWCLFHLDDYAISTVSGPTYWLMKRKD